MFKITTEIDIDASAELVWRILVDFARYPEWNPFIRQAQGEPRVGARLRVMIQPSGKSSMVFKPRVLKSEPGQELRWLGHLAFPGLFDGEHGFLLTPLPGGGCRLRQTEDFSGILVPLFKKSLETDTKRGFEEMNQALKTRAEQQAEGQGRS